MLHTLTILPFLSHSSSLLTLTLQLSHLPHASLSPLLPSLSCQSSPYDVVFLCYVIVIPTSFLFFTSTTITFLIWFFLLLELGFLNIMMHYYWRWTMINNASLLSLYLLILPPMVRCHAAYHCHQIIGLKRVRIRMMYTLIFYQSKHKHTYDDVTYYMQVL